MQAYLSLGVASVKYKGNKDLVLKINRLWFVLSPAFFRIGRKYSVFDGGNAILK